MKIYLISGEASGDLHGSNLLHALYQKRNDLDVRAWGGDKIKKAGATLVRHIKELAFMGFLEVAKNLPTILSNIDFCKKDILNFQPDVLVLIDYPGFNLRIAKWAKSKGIKVVYYISPQLWAWNSKRVKQIQKNVDRMITILPFEKEFYANYGIDVDYVGHPLVEVKKGFIQETNFASKHNLTDRDILLLLPGSRKQEIIKILPIMLEAAKRLDKYQIVIAGVSTIEASDYASIIKNEDVKIITDQNYQLLSISKMAWVSSGTATLETALFNVPQIVCYKGNEISYQIAKRLVSVPYISLVNLIANEEIVKELIQHALTADRLFSETKKLALDSSQMKALYASKVENQLGEGNASSQAAKIILEL